MFATLDPKLRAIELPSRRKILLSDTVGFIRNLPHTLVTSFRATLEEVAQAEVLLHVRDVASTYTDDQKLQVEKVLAELEVMAKPRIEVLNKIDLLDDHQREGLLGRAAVASDAEVLVSPLRQAREPKHCCWLSTPHCVPTRSSMRSCSSRSRRAACWLLLRREWSSASAITRPIRLDWRSAALLRCSAACANIASER